MKKKLFVFVFLKSISLSFSQEITSLGKDAETIDSLKTAYKTAENDSLRSLFLFRLAGYNKKNAQDSEFKKHLDLAMHYAKDNEFLLDYSGYFRALQYLNQTDIEKFIAEISKTQKKLKKYNNKKSIQLQLIILQNVSTYYLNEIKHEKSIDILIEEAIPLAIKTNNNLLLASFYESIADSFYSLDQFNKAEQYYDKALETFIKIDTPEKNFLAMCYIYAANNLLELGKYTKSASLLKNAEGILNESPQANFKSHFYYVMGEYYFFQKQFENALKNYDLGFKYLNETKNEYLIFSLNISKGETLYELKRYNESHKILSQLYAEAKLPALHRVNFYRVYANTLEKLKKYDEALGIAKLLAKLEDSLDSEINDKNILELEAKYQNAENEKKITTLESEKKLAQLSANNNRLYNWLLGISAVFMLLFAVFLWFYYRKNKKLAQQKEINYQQQLKELNQLEQLNSAKAMLTGEEKERKRVAQDLHDGLGGILAGIKMNLSKITGKQENVGDVLVEIQDKVDYSLVELRRIARNMMPESLIKFGLDTALRDLCELYRTPTTQIEYLSFQVENTIPQQNQLLIYRVVQELLSNAIKHSGATNVLVQCSQNGNTFFLTVEDNGKGFNKELLFEKPGMGFGNIKNRVAYLNGTLEINSTPKEGTIINIELDVTK